MLPHNGVTVKDLLAYPSLRTSTAIEPPALLPIGVQGFAPAHKAWQPRRVACGALVRLAYHVHGHGGTLGLLPGEQSRRSAQKKEVSRE
jgi:hypothetical protein